MHRPLTNSEHNRTPLLNACRTLVVLVALMTCASARGTPPTMPPAATFLFPEDGIRRCRLHEPCAIKLGFAPITPTPKQPDAYPRSKPISAAIRWSIYRYTHTETDLSGITAAPNFTINAETLPLRDNQAIGHINFNVNRPGDYLGELVLDNPALGHPQRLHFAVLAEDDAVFVHRTIPDALKQIPLKDRLPLFRRRYERAKARRAEVLGGLDAEAACLNDVRDPDFDIVASTRRCKEATDALHRAAKALGVAPEQVVHYRNGSIRSETKGTFKGIHNSFTSKIALLPYTPIRLTVRSTGPVTVSLVADGTRRNSFGGISLRTHRPFDCAGNDSYCPRGPEKDGSYLLEDFLVSDEVLVSVEQPPGLTAPQRYELLLEELDELPF